MRALKKRIILTSHAAGGKDFLRDEFIAQGISADISLASRPMREGEEDGKTYHFVSEYIFKQFINLNAFFEYVCFNGWYYGTTHHCWNNVDVFIMTSSGIAQIPEADRKDCFVIFMDIPKDARIERLLERSDADSMERRVLADEKDFEGFDDYDMIIKQPLFNAVDVVKQALQFCS